MNMHARFTAMLLFGLTQVLPVQADTHSDNPVAVTSSASQFNTPLTTQASLGSSPAPLRANRRHSDHSNNVTSPDFWIYDSEVSLHRDSDADGYYSTFRLTMDADTVYNAAAVYAVIFVGHNDVYESVYTTSVFTLYSDDSQDSLTIDSELVTGYPPREYHILIELYDAGSHRLVAYSDDYDDADLAYLSLESSNHEQPFHDTVVVVEKHGGSLSMGGLVAFGISAISLLMWRRRSGVARINRDKRSV